MVGTPLKIPFTSVILLPGAMVSRQVPKGDEHNMEFLVELGWNHLPATAFPDLHFCEYQDEGGTEFTAKGTRKL